MIEYSVMFSTSEYYQEGKNRNNFAARISMRINVIRSFFTLIKFTAITIKSPHEKHNRNTQQRNEHSQMTTPDRMR